MTCAEAIGTRRRGTNPSAQRFLAAWQAGRKVELRGTVIATEGDRAREIAREHGLNLV
jgi:hypothetical protein